MNKGFTLIELIGTIVILAVISLIAFPSVVNLLSQSNKTVDDKTKDFICAKAVDYANENKDDYSNSLTVADLMNKGYLSTSIVCGNCELANDKITITFDGTKYSATYTEQEGEDCPSQCK